MSDVDEMDTTDRFDRRESWHRAEHSAGPRGGLVPFQAPSTSEGPVPSEARDDTALPNRYEIRNRDDGRMLCCGEAPGVAVSIDRNHQMSEADARRLGEQHILLDGAGQFAPTIDVAQSLYNLDHHEGCLRPFTLASCQQALILVLQGLELDRGDWTVLANEPDLDTVFAVWVLLNHRRVRRLTQQQKDDILPLILLEGSIDANGFELAESCGLPQDLVVKEKARLDRLHAIELELKGSGGWDKADLAEYTLAMLLEIDKLVFRPSDFSGYASVDEVYGHVDIGEGKVAVVCRDGSGIYEVERRLKTTWGDRLGIVALERSPNHFTLRRTASLAGIELASAYGKLNLLDPRVDGRPPEKRWGGSDEIGGSPRPAGTALTAREIAKILRMTYQRVRPMEHLQRYLSATLWALLLLLGAGVAVVSWRVFVDPIRPSLAAATELAVAAVVIALGGMLLTRKLSRGWTWLFGWRRPAGRDWLALTPLVLASAAAGGIWMPRLLAKDPPTLAATGGAMVLAVVALELCFRGLAHGLLILDSRVQAVGSRWFVSAPVASSALLYALATVAASHFWTAGPPAMLQDLSDVPELAVTGVAALVFGLSAGMIRERSMSVWPAVGTAVVGGALRVALELW